MDKNNGENPGISIASYKMKLKKYIPVLGIVLVVLMSLLLTLIITTAEDMETIIVATPVLSSLLILSGTLVLAYYRCVTVVDGENIIIGRVFHSPYRLTFADIDCMNMFINENGFILNIFSRGKMVFSSDNATRNVDLFVSALEYHKIPEADSKGKPIVSDCYEIKNRKSNVYVLTGVFAFFIVFICAIGIAAVFSDYYKGYFIYAFVVFSVLTVLICVLIFKNMSFSVSLNGEYITVNKPFGKTLKYSFSDISYYSAATYLTMYDLNRKKLFVISTMFPGAVRFKKSLTERKIKQISEYSNLK